MIVQVEHEITSNLIAYKTFPSPFSQKMPNIITKFSLNGLFHIKFSIVLLRRVPSEKKQNWLSFLPKVKICHMK